MRQAIYHLYYPCKESKSLNSLFQSVVMFPYGIAAFGSALGFALLLWRSILPDPWLAWLLAINLAAFMIYAHDKRLAGTGRFRVPERDLLALAAVGGTAGAFAGMHLFHHKTAKARFQHRFWLIVLAQVALAVIFYLL